MTSALTQPLASPLTMLLVPIGFLGAGIPANAVVFNGEPFAFNGMYVIATFN